MEAIQVRFGDPQYFEVMEFLIREAELLDGNRFREWLRCLADDLVYTMPVRMTLKRAAGAGFSDTMSHFDDTLSSITQRVKRLETQSAWAEDPPSRTRRFVSNVRVERVGNDELKVASYLLTLRNRLDTPSFQIISAERKDVLRRTENGLKLVKREILVDQSSLGVENLGIFL